MRKKIVAAIKSRSQKIVDGMKTPVIVYYANPKSHIPHTITMPAPAFYETIEKHLQIEATIIPIKEEKITWKLFIKHNPGFKKLRINITRVEARSFPEKAWDNLVLGIIDVLKEQHQSTV